MTTQDQSLRSIELLTAYFRHPSLSLRNELVTLNTGLVRQVAHRMSRQCSEPYEDLMQIGYLGLIRAIERYNPHHGYAFSSFAIPYIRGEILHYLRDRGSTLRIPRRWQDLQAKSKKLRKDLTSQLGRPPHEREMAEALGVSLQEWEECQLALQNRMLVSLDATIHQNQDVSVSFGDIIPDERYHDQQKQAEDRHQLEVAMEKLEEKTKAALECVFLMDLPRKEAAKHIGISPMTVTRHLQKGIETLEGLLQVA